MAAVADNFEIESFIGKFIYLSSRGYVANLSFSTSNGNDQVNFQASLSSSRPSLYEFYPRREKPSRMRRRHRRKEDLANYSSSSSNFNETSNFIPPITSEATNLQLTESNTTLPPQDIHVAQVQRDTAVSTADVSHSTNCKVDAAAQTFKTSIDAATETEPAKPVMLSTTVNPSQSIAPRQIYHPALINVSKSLYQRHPSELTKEEFKRFNQYLHNERK